MLTNFRLLGVNLLGVNLKGVQFWGWGHLGLGVRKICSNFNIFEELSFLGLRLSSASFFSLFFFLSFFFWGGGQVLGLKNHLFIYYKHFLND